MNWTGGGLSRSKRHRNTSGGLTARQKQHFAKARNQQVNGFIKRSPLKLPFGNNHENKAFDLQDSSLQRSARSVSEHKDDLQHPCRKKANPSGREEDEFMTPDQQEYVFEHDYKGIQKDSKEYFPALTRQKSMNSFGPQHNSPSTRLSTQTTPSPSSPSPVERTEFDQSISSAVRRRDTEEVKRLLNQRFDAWVKFCEGSDGLRRVSYSVSQGVPTCAYSSEGKWDFNDDSRSITKAVEHSPEIDIQATSDMTETGQPDKERRKRLLNKWDWTGVNILEPMKLQWKDTEDNERLGKRRRIIFQHSGGTTIDGPFLRESSLESRQFSVSLLSPTPHSLEASLHSPLGHEHHIQGSSQSPFTEKRPSETSRLQSSQSTQQAVANPRPTTKHHPTANNKRVDSVDPIVCAYLLSSRGISLDGGTPHDTIPFSWSNTEPSDSVYTNTCAVSLQQPIPRSSQRERMLHNLLHSGSSNGANTKSMSISTSSGKSNDRESPNHPRFDDDNVSHQEALDVDYRECFVAKPKGVTLSARARAFTAIGKKEDDAQVTAVAKDTEEERWKGFLFSSPGGEERFEEAMGKRKRAHEAEVVDAWHF